MHKRGDRLSIHFAYKSFMRWVIGGCKEFWVLEKVITQYQSSVQDKFRGIFFSSVDPSETPIPQAYIEGELTIIKSFSNRNSFL